MNLEKNFWSKVNRENWKHVFLNTCWNWLGGRTSWGYGQFRSNELPKESRAHRIAWIISKGKIPKDKYVLHKCDNRLCVNPEHLWLGTKKDNTQDMLKKGRMNIEGFKIGWALTGESAKKRNVRKRGSNGKFIRTQTERDSLDARP